jgi:hypothetical protein
VSPTPFLVAGTALVLVLATQLIDFGAADLRFRLLDSSSEWSWSHLGATVAFALATLAGVAGARWSGSHRRTWLATGVLFGLLLVDNVTRLHTHISVWPALYAPILLGASVCAWRLARGTREAAVVACGLAALVVSLGIHVLGPHVVHTLGWGTDSWAYQIKVGLKEGLELAGWVLVAPALCRLARDARGRGIFARGAARR